MRKSKMKKNNLQTTLSPNDAKPTPSVLIMDENQVDKIEIGYLAYSQFSLPYIYSVGRENIVKQISTRISSNGFCALSGRKYIGKTSIACRVAKELSNGKTIYFDFKATEETSDQFIDLIYTLNYRQTKDLNVSQSLFNVLNSQDIFFVLDNFEYAKSEVKNLIIDILFKGISKWEYKSRILVIFSTSSCDEANNFNKFKMLFDVPGIDSQDAICMAQTEGILLPESAAKKLIDRYNGSPVFVQLALENCKKFYNKNIDDFLASNDRDYENELLSKQFNSLSATLQDLLWAIVVLGDEANKNNIVHYGFLENGQAFSASIQILHDLNFIVCYNTENIVLIEPIKEFILDLIVSTIADEIINSSPNKLQKFPLLMNSLSEDARTFQKNILQRIINHSLQSLSSKELLNRIKNCINLDGSRTYLAGNILNLIGIFNEKISDLKFNNAFILEADLSNNDVSDVDFSGAIFENCSFKAVFGSVTAMSYNSELRLIATGFFNGLIILWDEYGRQVLALHKFQNNINAIRFYDRVLFVACKSGEIKKFVFDEEMELVQENVIAEGLGVIRSLEISNKNNCLIVGLEAGNVLIYELNNFCSPTEIINIKVRVKALSISLNERYLAIGGDSEYLYLYDFNNNRIVSRWRVNNRWIRCLQFYDDDTIICGGDSGNLNIIYISKNYIEDVLCVDKNKIWSLAMLPSYFSVVTGGDDGTLRIIDIKTKSIKCILRKHVSWVRNVIVTNQFIYSGGEDQTICIWKLHNYKCYRILKGYTKRVFSVATINGDVYAGLGDHSVVKINHDFKPQFKVFSCADQVWTVSVSRDLIAAGCDRGDVYIFDLKHARMVFNRHFNAGWIGNVQFNSAGNQLAVGDELGNIYIFDVHDIRFISQITKYKAHNGRVSSIKFCENDIIVSVGEDGCLCSYNSDSGIVKKLEVSCGLLYSVENIEANKFITAGSTGEVYVVDIEHSRIDSQFSLAMPIWAIKYLNSNEIFFALDNGELSCFTLSGKKVYSIGQHQNQIWSIAYDDVNNQIVSGGEDSKLIYYNLENGTITIDKVIICDRPYDNVILSNCEGLSPMQINYLCSMGAKV